VTRALRLLIVAGCLAASGRTASAQTFDRWFEDRVQAMLDARTIGENGKGADKQRGAPASDTRSTSLVDASSSTDFVSAAVNLARLVPAASALASAVSPASGTEANGGSEVVTTSVYALIAGLSSTAPTDPAFYKAHVDARRGSLTVGTTTSDLFKDNTDRPGAVVGGKVVLWNGRDLYRPQNLAVIDTVQGALRRRTVASAVLKDRIQRLFFLTIQDQKGSAVDEAAFVRFIAAAPSPFSDQEFPNTLRAAGPDAVKRVDSEILAAISTFAEWRDVVEQAYDKIRSALQIAIVYVGVVRSEQGYNDHRGEIALDYGMTDRLNWTLNGSVDVRNKKAFGTSTNWRVATEFTGDLSRVSQSWGRSPLRLSFSAEVKRIPRGSIARHGQAALTIPIASGLDLPIVYRIGNATSETPGGSEARISLSVDLLRLLQAGKS
jgi:hypothetical protein